MADTQLPSIAYSRAALATAPGRRKLDVILNSGDPAAFVRRLPAEDLYFAVREIGLADSAEVVALAAPEQFRAFVDLDAWDRDRPDPSRVLLWLRLALEGGGPADLRRKRHALDPEVLLLVLRTQTTVHELEEGVDPVLTSQDFVRTPEGKYLVEIHPTGEDGAAVRRLLEDYIDESPFEATRLFEAVRWEMGAELEETALRWRTGRLRDMGFPEPEEAAQIWAPLPVEPGRVAAPAREPGPLSGVPALLLVSGTAPLLLDRAAEQLGDAERTRFNEGLVYLLNCSLVAEGVEPRDLDRARPVLEAARDLLSLGLELACGGDEAAAPGVLAATPPKLLFRGAVTRLARLAREAGRVARRLDAVGPHANLLDSPDSESLSGLLRRRPRVYDPHPPAGRAGPWRGFRDGRDLEAVQQAVARAEAAAGVLEALGVDKATLDALADRAGRTRTAVTVGQLALTAAVRAALGVEPRPEPLDAPLAGRVCALFQGAALSPDAHEALGRFWAGLRAALPAAAADAFDALRRGWTARLEAEVGPACAAGGYDPRYLECVLAEAGVTGIGSV